MPIGPPHPRDVHIPRRPRFEVRWVRQQRQPGWRSGVDWLWFPFPDMGPGYWRRDIRWRIAIEAFGWWWSLEYFVERRRT